MWLVHPLDYLILYTDAKIVFVCMVQIHVCFNQQIFLQVQVGKEFIPPVHLFKICIFCEHANFLLSIIPNISPLKVHVH